MKTPRGLRALLVLLREHGVTEYSAGGVTIKLSGVAKEAVPVAASPTPPALSRSKEPEDPRWSAVNELKKQYRESMDG